MTALILHRDAASTPTSDRTLPHAGRTEHATGGSTNREMVLLLGNYRPALTVARALSGHGFGIVMGLHGGEGCTEYSRFVDESWDHPELAATDEFAAALDALLTARPDITAIFPVAEEFVRFFADREPALPAHVTLASPRADVVRLCGDKMLTLDLCKSVGVPQLPYRAIAAREEIMGAAREVGFPLVIRPLHGTARIAHKKALIVADERELERLIPLIPPEINRLLLQRRAKGERQDIFFAALNGEILSAVQFHCRRTDRIDGTGLGVDGVTTVLDPNLLKHCRNLARALNYTGAGNAQFFVDPASRNVCFIELNPRIAALHRVPELMGMDLSALAIALARGAVKPDALAGFTYPAGRRFAWTYGELRGIKSALRNGEIGWAGAARWVARMLRSAIGAHFHSTWRWDDPIPTIMLYARQFGLGARPRGRESRP